MFSAAIFEIYFYSKDILIAVTDYNIYFLPDWAISFDSSNSIEKFYTFRTFRLLINAVILLLNYLVLILCLYMHIVSHVIFSCTVT